MTAQSQGLPSTRAPVPPSAQDTALSSLLTGVPFRKSDISKSVPKSSGGKGAIAQPRDVGKAALTEEARALRSEVPDFRNSMHAAAYYMQDTCL